MLAERRDLYRVTPGAHDPLGVALIDEAGGARCARVADVTARGAGASVSPDAWPALKPGDQVTLAFSSPRLARPVRVRAALMKVDDAAGVRHYGFRFLGESDLTQALPGEMFQLFNRRGAYRAPDLDDAPLEMRPFVASANRFAEPAAARLKNLSATGLGALGGVDARRRLEHAESVHATLRLPGRPTPLQLVAWVRNREVYGDMVYYGIEFDTRRTPDYLDLAEDIVEFVMECVARGPRPH